MLPERKTALFIRKFFGRVNELFPHWNKWAKQLFYFSKADWVAKIKRSGYSAILAYYTTIGKINPIDKLCVKVPYISIKVNYLAQSCAMTFLRWAGRFDCPLINLEKFVQWAAIKARSNFCRAYAVLVSRVLDALEGSGGGYRYEPIHSFT